MPNPISAAALSIATVVDPETVEAVRTELASAGPAKLKEEADAVDDILGKVFAAAGDDLDLSADAAKELDGFDVSVKERATKVVQLHSRGAAIQDLRADKSRVEHVKAEIERRRELADMGIDPDNVVPFPNPNPRGQVIAAPKLSDGLFAAARDGGFELKDLKQAAQPRGIHVQDIDPRAWLFPDLYGAVVKTDEGWDPFVVRMPGHTPAISRPLQVYDTLPMSMTSQHAIEYMVQTTRNAAAIVEKAEGVDGGEAAMEWTERTEPMREIPGWIPITEIQLEDEPQIRAIVDADLRLMVLQRLDGQLLNGDGAAANIAGIGVGRSGVNPLSRDWTSVGATGTARNDQIDDMKRAKTQLVLQGRVMPNVVYMHHNIWDEIALSETTSAGYYLGSPASDFQERIWSLPVVLTDHLSDGLAAGNVGAMIADTMYIRHWVRRGIHTEIGLRNDDFTKRQLTIRAGLRCCVQVRRPQAVLRMTMKA